MGDLKLPTGRMQPVGYIVLQHSVRLDRPVQAYNRWIARIPQVYRNAVLGEPENGDITVIDDPHCLALLKHYRSLMPLAQEARKPMFYLKPADGAIGAHLQAVQSAHRDFVALAHGLPNGRRCMCDEPPRRQECQVHQTAQASALLRPFFWDHDFKTLTWDEAHDLIIARVLASGTWVGDYLATRPSRTLTNSVGPQAAS